MRPSRLLLAAAVAFATARTASAQRDTLFTHADTLRGSNTPQRAWWDATFYDLHVTVHPADSSISGWNGITYRVLSAPNLKKEQMQIDLQVPLEIDSITDDGQASHLPARRQRVLRHAPRHAQERLDRNDRRVLPRQAARRQTPAVGWRTHLAARLARQSLDRHREPRARRQRLVAQQGLRRRRARQPAHCHHRARFDVRRVEWPPALHRTSRRRNHHLRVVRREPDQQLRRGDQRRTVRALQRSVLGRERPAHDGLLAPRLSPRHCARAVQAGRHHDAVLRILVRAVSLLRGWLQARRGAAPRHGASERHRLWERLHERLPHA